MSLVLVVVAVAVTGVVVMVALGRIRGGLDEARPARADHELPLGRLSVADLAGVRFSVAPRGYRMSEVDEFVDRLRDELSAAQNELATVMVEKSRLEKARFPNASLTTAAFEGDRFETTDEEGQR